MSLSRNKTEATEKKTTETQVSANDNSHEASAAKSQSGLFYHPPLSLVSAGMPQPSGPRAAF